MKAKLLSFPFICFSESGLFNGLRPIQIKKILSLVTLWLKYHKSRFLCPPLTAGRRVIHVRSAEIHLAHIQFFRKKMSKNFMGGRRFLREAGLCAAQSDADGAPL